MTATSSAAACRVTRCRCAQTPSRSTCGAYAHSSCLRCATDPFACDSGKQFVKLRARAEELQALKQVRRTRAQATACALRSPARAWPTTVRAAYCALRVCEVRCAFGFPLPCADCLRAATGCSAALRAGLCT